MECGCGRSPTGNCIGWHKLSEEEYQEKLKEYQDKEKEEDQKLQKLKIISRSLFELLFQKVNYDQKDFSMHKYAQYVFKTRNI